MPILLANALLLDASAATLTWNRDTTGRWLDPANWTPNQVPTTNDTVVIDRAGTYSINIDGAIAAKDIRLGSSSGQITISGSGSLTLEGEFESKAASQHSINGITLQGSGRLVHTATNELVLINVTLEVPLVNRGALALLGHSVMHRSMQNQTGAIVRVEGSPQVGHSQLTLDASFTNFGLVELTSAYQATLAVRTGLLVNASSGIIHARRDGGGQRFIAAQLLNQGLVDIEAPTTFSLSDVPFANAGIIRVRGTGSLTASAPNAAFSNAGTLDLQNGAAIFHGLKLFNNTGTISIAPDATFRCQHFATATSAFNYLGGSMTGGGKMAFAYCTVNLSLPWRGMQNRIELEGARVFGPGTLDLGQSGFLWFYASEIHTAVTNAGEIEAIGACQLSASYTAKPGSKLGVHTFPPVWQNSTLSMASGFENHGTLDFDGSKWPGTVQLIVTNGPILSPPSGIISITAHSNGVTRISAPIVNHGRIKLNSGRAVFARDLILGPLSVLETDLSGPHPGTGYPSLQSEGALALGGVLRVGLLNGFRPAPNTIFSLLSYPSRRGGFTAIEGRDLGDGLFLQAVREERRLDLVAKSLHRLPPPIPTNIFNTSVPLGEDARFGLSPLGFPPFTYQWLFNGTPMPNETNGFLIVRKATPAAAGLYGVIVTDSFGLIEVYSAMLSVLVPPGISREPAAQSVSPGGTVSLSVAASGDGPFSYQWRRNGATLAEATNDVLTISGFTPSAAGSYDVVIHNPAGAVVSKPAALQVLVPQLPATDSFAARGEIVGASGAGRTVTTAATIEPGEPRHAGRPGGRSTWVRWIAPASGPVVFTTQGSDFDTLLAAYTGTGLAALKVADADDDRGGFSTSQIAFDALRDTEYAIAVDGLNGSAGELVLNWNLRPEAPSKPLILTHPAPQSTPLGGSAQFTVFATSKLPLSYQWLLNGSLAIQGATSNSLQLLDIGPLDSGQYTVEVTDAAGQTIESLPAALELGPDPKAITEDKLLNLTIASLAAAPASTGGRKTFASVAAGLPGTQIFNNFGASTERSEPLHAGVLGGASRWFSLKPAADGLLVVDTIGSAIDTVLAVYTGNGLLDLKLIVQDNNGAPDRIRSQVEFASRANTTYLVAVDGVRGEQGEIVVNWVLVAAPSITLGPSSVKAPLGGEARFEVVAKGGRLEYQWRFNGGDLPGETNSTLRLKPVAATHAGSYSVRVANPAGQIVSSPAILEIGQPSDAVALNVTIESGSVVVQSLGGIAGSVWIMESSFDLKLWKPVVTNTAPVQLRLRPESLDARSYFRARSAQ